MQDLWDGIGHRQDEMSSICAEIFPGVLCQGNIQRSDVTRVISMKSAV